MKIPDYRVSKTQLLEKFWDESLRLVNAISKVEYVFNKYDTELMISYISENYHYISAVNNSYASDKLYSFFFSYFYLRIGNLLKNHRFFGQDITRYMSVLSAQELIFWISNKRNEKNALLIKRLNTIFRYLVTQYQSDIKRVY